MTLYFGHHFCLEVEDLFWFIILGDLKNICHRLRRDLLKRKVYTNMGPQMLRAECVCLKNPGTVYPRTTVWSRFTKQARRIHSLDQCWNGIMTTGRD